MPRDVCLFSGSSSLRFRRLSPLVRHLSDVRLHAGRKIANKPWLRHLCAALLLTAIALPNPGLAQSKYQPIELSERDVREVIEFYKTGNAAASVEALRSRMPAEIKDST